MNKDFILNYLLEHKVELLRKFHLSKIGLFGSFVRGEETANSDIDLLVEFLPGTEDLFELKLALKKALKKDFKRDIDICREKYIKPYYRKQIFQSVVYV